MLISDCWSKWGTEEIEPFFSCAVFSFSSSETISEDYLWKTYYSFWGLVSSLFGGRLLLFLFTSELRVCASAIVFFET
jgi:hypothetical protein